MKTMEIHYSVASAADGIFWRVSSEVAGQGRPASSGTMDTFRPCVLTP